MRNWHPRLQQLQRHGVDIRLWNQGHGNLHRNTVQADGSQLLMGSANGSDTTLNNQEPVVWLQLDKSAVEAEAARFQEMWDLSEALLLGS